MANNFRKTGAYYISKDGNDANDGLTPDTPKATLAVYGAGVHIVGSGEYEGAFNLGSITFTADGIVKINMTANMVAGNTVLNGLFYIVGNGFNISFTNQIFEANDCIFEDCLMQQTPFIGYLQATRCTLINVTTSSSFIPIINYCKIFNSVLTLNLFSGLSERINNSYIDASTTFTMSSWFTSPTSEFINNNYQGSITIGVTTYELKKDKAGNAIDPNPFYSDLVAIDANVYTRFNFSQDAEFLNLVKSNYFAVSPTSPNIFAASNATQNIGNVKAAVNIKATDLEFSSPVSNNGLIFSSGDIVWDSAPGILVSQPIQLTLSENQVLKSGSITGALNFNSLEAIGSAKNKNVVAKTNYAGGTAGANPRRVCIVEMRWKSTLSPPTVDSDYDNNLYVTAGDYSQFEILGKTTDFLIDTNGVGTGDPNFISSGASNIAPVWVQIRLTVLEGIG